MTPCNRWDGKHRKSDGRPMLGKRYAYRVLYEAVFGPLPRWVALHHKCHHEWCVNVFHLEPITQSAHAKEHKVGGDWGQAKKTHCPSRHPYDDTNTYIHIRKDGRVERHCRECVRDAKRRWRAKKF